MMRNSTKAWTVSHPECLCGDHSYPEECFIWMDVLWSNFYTKRVYTYTSSEHPLYYWVIKPPTEVATSLASQISFSTLKKKILVHINCTERVSLLHFHTFLWFESTLNYSCSLSSPLVFLGGRGPSGGDTGDQAQDLAQANHCSILSYISNHFSLVF